MTHIVVLVSLTDTRQFTSDRNPCSSQYFRRSDTASLQNHWGTKRASREDDKLAGHHIDVGRRSSSIRRVHEPDAHRPVVLKEDGIDGPVGQDPDLSAILYMTPIGEVHFGGI